MPVAGYGEFHLREAVNHLFTDLGCRDEVIIHALFWPSCWRLDSLEQSVGAGLIW